MTIALAAVVTKDLLLEYRLFRASFRIHHGFEPLSVVHCDAITYDFFRGLPGTIAIPTVPRVDRPASQRSSEFRAIVRHKMLAITDAWRLLSPDAVAYIDADMVATAPFFKMFAAFLAPLTLSPHYWGGEVERRNRMYGFYNSGLVLTRDRCFSEWWLARFDDQPERFADQECLNDAPAAFVTTHFPEPWNVGYWRRVSRTEIPSVSPDTITFHAHVFAPAREVNPFEIGQKQFVLAALKMLGDRGTSADHHLLRVIHDLGHGIGGGEGAGLITQNYPDPSPEPSTS